MKQIHIEKSSKVTICRGCKGKNFKPWIDLGMQPLANNLLKKEQLESSDELYFPLAMMYCLDCELVQTTHTVNPELLFNDYLYYSSTSSLFQEHFQTLAEKEFNSDRVHKGDLVIDIGSNDGILLKPFQKLGAEVLGIEPAKKIAAIADKKGVATIAEYFTLHLAKQILKTKGEARLITMTNVFAHVPDLDEVMEGVKGLLSLDGRFMVEVAYLPDMLKYGTFDLLYHEHVCSWHLYPMYQFFKRHDMHIDEVEFIPVHGGSIRVYAKLGKDKDDNRAMPDKGLVKDKLFRDFPKKVEKNKENILKLLATLKRRRFSIIGYGAPAKMSTMTNYFGIGSETIDWIIEDAEAKQYHYSPGKHIKIVPPPEFMYHPGDYMFIFAWNFAESIIQKTRRLGYKGKYIIPFPRVNVI